MQTPTETFIIDCHTCRAKVAALEQGRAERTGWNDEAHEPYGYRLVVASCPQCQTFLVGESRQVNFEGYDSEYDRWSDAVRVYPQPTKVFSSSRIPRVVRDSLSEAERSLQAGANIAACVMLGRALEALARDVISAHDNVAEPIVGQITPKTRKRTLDQGIRRMHDLQIIDKRLYEWSQQLRAFRNLAAHPEDIQISRHEVSDLQSFTNAIVEYVYDLTDRYNEFQARLTRRSSRRRLGFELGSSDSSESDSDRD